MSNLKQILETPCELGFYNKRGYGSVSDVVEDTSVLGVSSRGYGSSDNDINNMTGNYMVFLRTSGENTITIVKHIRNMTGLSLSKCCQIVKYQGKVRSLIGKFETWQEAASYIVMLSESGATAILEKIEED